MIGKIPKLAIVGLAVLLIGFGPEILAIVNIDTVGPNIRAGFPGGSDIAPTPITYGESYWIYLISDEQAFEPSVLINSTDVYNLTWKPSTSSTYEYGVTWIATPNTKKVRFDWFAKDLHGLSSSAVSYAQLMTPEGDFYINDILVTKDAVIDLTTRILSFKFIATKEANIIQRVEIEIVGQKTFDLVRQADGVTWDGKIWEAPADGSYTIYGYFYASGEKVRGLSIIGGLNEDAELPGGGWTMYDWLKILGGALIVVGFITKK